MLFADGTFLVEPGTGLIVWAVLSVLGLITGTVTAAKGRWGWFILGLATFSLLWYVGAVLAPKDNSVWVWLRARRAAS
jgi:hypothetical protein